MKGMSDHVWPISVRESPLQQLRYIYCKGAKYPLVASRPTPVIAPWKLSLCDQVGGRDIFDFQMIDLFFVGKREGSAGGKVAAGGDATR